VRRQAEARVLEIVGRIAERDPKQIAREALLVADLNIDSPNALLLLVELEDAFGITMSDSAAARMRTVGDILDYLDGRI
jgi:acyl carrier protein